MLHVVHVITHFDLGGAEQIAINICKSKTKGFQYHLFEVVRGKSKFTQDLLKEFDACGVKYHRSAIANKKLAILISPFRLFFYKLFNRVDIIHTHTEIPDLTVYIFHKLFGWAGSQKYVRTIHNTQLWNEWKSIGNYVEPFYQKRKANVAISKSVKDKYEEQYD